MTRPPDFDELVDPEVDGDERERLRRAHELLVAAGPPPELSPELERGPALALTLRRPERSRARRSGAPPRRVLLLAAALVAVIAVFFTGYATGNKSGSQDTLAGGWVVHLHPAAGATAATAAIRVGTRDPAGNWPMHLVATGLPQLPKGGYYEVFLTRNGKTVGPCGSFLTRDGDANAYLNAPYRVAGAGWIVTAQREGDSTTGRVVLTT